MAHKDKRENGSAIDDTEFEKLLDEMDELGRQADALRKKVNFLIDEMRENDVAVEEDAADADNEASAEARNADNVGSADVRNQDNVGSADIGDADRNAP